MTVSVVTYRKGGAPDAIAAAARKGKAVWDRSGAQNFMLSFVAAGPDAGQSVVLITFANWEAFGKAMEVASADPGLAASSWRRWMPLSGISVLFSAATLG